MLIPEGVIRLGLPLCRACKSTRRLIALVIDQRTFLKGDGKEMLFFLSIKHNAKFSIVRTNPLQNHESGNARSYCHKIHILRKKRKEDGMEISNCKVALNAKKANSFTWHHPGPAQAGCRDVCRLVVCVCAVLGKAETQCPISGQTLAMT